MMPQSAFFVLDAVRTGAEESVRALLETMNAAPGHANPQNEIVPFGAFEELHFARMCLVDDPTTGDVAAYRIRPRTYRTYLAFLGDVDGDAKEFLARLADRASDGLRRLFANCEGFSSGTDLLRYMNEHSIRAAALYANWKGRTMLQVREEDALHSAVTAYLDANADTLSNADPQKLHAVLRKFLSGEIASARLTMTPAPPTRLRWWIQDVAATIGFPLALIILSPILLVAGIVLLVLVRMQEARDPEICPRPDLRRRVTIENTEDRDVTNAFTALGSLKPGPVRRLISIFGLWLLDYASQHVYTKGHLARVRTIHFARWVWLDHGQRLIFLSNYDGSLESYMDDFINKAGFGLNFVFSNGIGYPRTRWLLADGSKDEQRFKNFLRRHQIETQVWYDAHPGLTAVDLDRNSRIRNGLEARFLTPAEAREWAALL